MKITFLVLMKTWFDYDERQEKNLRTTLRNEGFYIKLRKKFIITEYIYYLLINH